MTIGPSTGGIWEPLRQHPFSKTCTSVGHRPATADYAASVRWADVIVAVKAQPLSFGLALQLSKQHRKPLALDVDDPDLERQARRLPGCFGLGSATEIHATQKVRTVAWLKDEAKSQRYVSVSNPSLRRWYTGATVIPHVRLDPGPPPALDWSSNAKLVAFVGSPKRHKGLPLLRAAIRELAPRGFQLLVTSPPPKDPASWETWTGYTTLSEGRGLINRAHAIAIPSKDTLYTRGQLPVKLIDGMLAGRLIVARDLPPIRWALAQTGVLVQDSDVRSWVRALASLEDPVSVEAQGLQTRQLALERFLPAAVAPRFETLLRACVAAAPVDA